MTHEVTMPQLGMAQDTGLIVSWIKQPGDPVKSGDVLMEIETDKSTMELEAAHDGFLTEIRAAAGEAVPVGNVIAIISDSAENIASAPATQDAIEDPKVVDPIAAGPGTLDRADANVDPDPPAARQSVSANGKVLASPKAKLAAFRRGIDLQQLVRRGVSQPIHAADLDNIAATTAITIAQSTLIAHVDRQPMDDFLEWTSALAGKPIGPASVWLAFVTRTFRRAVKIAPADGLVAEYAHHGADETPTITVDADLVVLSSVRALQEVDRICDIKILDLSSTRLADYRPSDGDGTPTIVIGAMGTRTYSISLHFQEDSVSLNSAITMLDDLASHAAEPMKHLL